MSSLPNEIFHDITNFLPNDDITDQILLSKTFNALVTPRLKKSIRPSPTSYKYAREWILQLNLKRFEPIGSVAKKRMKEVFENDLLHHMDNVTLNNGMLDGLKAKMSLERFDDPTFLRILAAIVSVANFREEYNISHKVGRGIVSLAWKLIINYTSNRFVNLLDLQQIWTYYN